jgi:hypothetical protein
MDKKKSLLSRDANNKLDDSEVAKVTNELMKKLITTERDFQKDLSFNHARGNKRDIMVYVTIFARNSIDGKIVLGDAGNGFVKLDDSGRDPYLYKDLEFIEMPLLAREMPYTRDGLGKGLFGLFNCVVQKLGRIGAIR